ncbi:hypothetical protein KSF_038630 [Reticulibacter mediterranei]|uniref:Uncharacterized protein n=1 Tax=Reticulibacter mediterranei TaxID=2778369 RepID=A0A8J3IJU9_9CHLR|nr:hypothetical protein [Reticulibacter mediterranei]GHO93815.1 hypothetical protein KSF_038630 [Reticulibacter mediterranei]
MPDKSNNSEFRTEGQSFPITLLFDIDGVITNPLTGRVEPEVIDKIARILDNGEPVAFNTGRGLQWISQDILPPLEHQLSCRSNLNKLCIAYQKGAFRVTFDKQGNLEKPVVAKNVVLIPSSLREEVTELILSNFAETMFPGEIKEAVLSPQMKPGADYMQYKADQAQLEVLLRNILLRTHLAHQFRVDPTRIATDIEDKQLGKALGARRILHWLEEQQIRSQSFIAFGDSPSDSEMAAEIDRNGIPVKFVFVGEKEQLRGFSFPFPIHLTDAICEKGTLEYLIHRKE